MCVKFLPVVDNCTAVPVGAATDFLFKFPATSTFPEQDNVQLIREKISAKNDSKKMKMTKKIKTLFIVHYYLSVQKLNIPRCQFSESSDLNII